MKRFYILIVIICSVITAKAQFGVGGGSKITGRISGTVIDSLTKKPLDYATVGLFITGGKTPITGVLTDDKGNFKLDNVKAGTYKLAITFIGYPSKIIDPVKTTDAKPDINIGTVVVAPSAKALKEVVIAGQAALVENHIDKIVYNAEKDLTAAGGNATDLLKKVPLVSVDLDGNVSVRGDANVRVLINGKPSGAVGSNVADVLKSIPADQIKNVEVITSPSAKYDAEGSAGIINIITKKKDVQGVSGSLSGGVGTRQNSGNLNLNIKKNRLSITTNLGTFFGWPQTSTTAFQVLNTTDNTITNSQSGTSKTSRHAYIGQGGLDYDFNGYNNFASTIRLNSVNFHIDGAADGYNLLNKVQNMFSTSSNSKTSIGGFDWNNDYTHKFKKEGHEISIAGQWSHNNASNNYTSLYTGTTGQNELGDNSGISNEYTLQTDYTLPVTKTFKLETGAKTIFRDITSDYEVQNQLNLPGSDAYVNNPARSNIYDYNQNVYAGYAVFDFTFKHGWATKFGTRYENTAIKGRSESASQGLAPFNQTYGTVVPSIIVSKSLSATQTVKASYTKRITRPSLTFLNPFLNASNIFNQSVGNPQLAPEVSHNFELNYSTFIKTSVINLSVFYKRTNDIIESYVTRLPYTYTINGATRTDTVSRTINGNVGANNSIGSSFFGSINPIKALTFRTSINVFTYHVNLYPQFDGLTTQTGTYWQYNAFVSGSATLGKGVTAETFLILNSPRRTFQGESPSFSIIVLALRKQIFNKKASIGLTAIDPFKETKYFNSKANNGAFTQTSSFGLPFRSFGINFSYTFGKLSFNTQNKKGVNNDDLKQGDQNGQQGGAGGSPTGGGR